jgi:hypothetical protein
MMLRPGWMQRYVPPELRDAARSILTAFGFIWRAEIEPDRVLDELTAASTDGLWFRVRLPAHRRVPRCHFEQEKTQ